jgi:hypothetical protein
VISILLVFCLRFLLSPNSLSTYTLYVLILVRCFALRVQYLYSMCDHGYASAALWGETGKKSTS